MADPRAPDDPSGCVIQSFGALLLCAAVSGVALSLMDKRVDLAVSCGLSASILFAGLAVSDALRRRR